MRTKKQLGKSLGQNEGFMTGGHQIVHARTYKRETPAWTVNGKEVQKVLLRAFPKLATDDRQRESAGRWNMVIHLYFRLGYTRGQIAEELDTTTERIKGVIRSIYRVSDGRRADGKGPLKRLKKASHAPKRLNQRKHY
jgi:hypothetical protein